MSEREARDTAEYVVRMALRQQRWGIKQLRRIVRRGEPEVVEVECPGCGEKHEVELEKLKVRDRIYAIEKLMGTTLDVLTKLGSEEQLSMLMRILSEEGMGETLNEAQRMAHGPSLQREIATALGGFEAAGSGVEGAESSGRGDVAGEGEAAAD